MLTKTMGYIRISSLLIKSMYYPLDNQFSSIVIKASTALQKVSHNKWKHFCQILLVVDNKPAGDASNGKVGCYLPFCTNAAGHKIRLWGSSIQHITNFRITFMLIQNNTTCKTFKVITTKFLSNYNNILKTTREIR